MARRRKQVPPQIPLVITAGPVNIVAPAIPVAQWINTGATAGGISSNVVSLSYDKNKSILLVTFKGYKTSPNPTYAYHGVPEIEARSMYHASSLGIFVRRRLEPFYYFHQI